MIQRFRPLGAELGLVPSTLFLLVAALFTSCKSAELLQSPQRSWIEADRARFDAIAVEYLELVRERVDRDPTDTWDELAFDVRKATVDQWKASLETAEASLAGGAQ